MLDSVSIAMRIKGIAAKKKVKIKDMLHDCDLSINTLSSMTARGSFPHCETLCKLADYLDVSTDYLLGRTDNPHVNK